MTNRWTADRGEMRQREILADRVSSGLSRNEQETGIQFFGDADRFEIVTYSPSLVRKILCHEFAEIESYFSPRDAGGVKKVSEPSEILDAEGASGVEGLKATLPLGTLSVKGVPRKRDRHSGIVSTPQDARNVADAFGGESDG